jgi:uncharacterized protein
MRYWQEIRGRQSSQRKPGLWTRAIARIVKEEAMEQKGRSQKKILTFLVLTFALSSVFYLLIGSAHSTQAAGGLYVFALMWCPALAALATQFAFERNLRHFGWGLPRRRFLALGYFLPVLYGLITYGIIWSTGLGGLSTRQLVSTISAQIGYQPTSSGLFALIYILFAATLLMIPAIVSALGEEIGWRGLLVPELAKTTTFTRAALLSGIIWALWHLPLILFADYGNGGSVWFAVTCFAVMTVAFSFVFAWLRLKSGSLWAPVLLHASHNVFIQNVFTPLTVNTGITAYVIDEFGIGLVIAFILLALYFWTKRGELPGRSQAIATAQIGAQAEPAIS